ncbi:leucine-rich repeat-containing protein 59-like isoform X2 [Phymastichus coffea]|uniref:leucine-rich repeat-containing protein 59-like isoform X2 n=1 Tax=Phymastichus coffea TaxID=108790 RepID=UPI00273BC2D0|nr:leucine-rich repeat-containing protein 59-like isoform X2 [Phymastichus coffea]
MKIKVGISYELLLITNLPNENWSRNMEDSQSIETARQETSNHGDGVPIKNLGRLGQALWRQTLTMQIIGVLTSCIHSGCTIATLSASSVLESAKIFRLRLAKMSGKLTVKDIKDMLDGDTLDFSLCNLEEVPVKEIATVKRFSHLDLSNNALTTLPKTFATLTQIVKLDLSKNMLTEIPENFGELKQLKHLDLYSNRISRLPLSLGELKNLKWLDLKENPLTPAVASIAGPCSNASECQACARNIVVYLANVKMTIDEEKQRRLTAVQEVEKAAASSKKEAKKKKKGAEKKITNKEKSPNAKKEQIQEKNNISKSPKSKTTNERSIKSRNSSGGVFSLLCKAFTSLIMWSAFFTLLTITIVTVLPLYDEQKSEEIFKEIEIRTGIPVKHYHHEGIKLLETFIVKTKLWTNHTREKLEKTYQQYFIEEPFTNKKEL